MKKGSSPEIHIGILKAGRIRFSLDGPHRIDKGDETLEGRAEARLKDGNIEVIQDNNIKIIQDEQHEDFGREVTLYPGDADSQRFTLSDVVIGIGFHWEQKEDQVFQGALKLKVVDGMIQAINIIPVENYLISVISSEMRGDSSSALLKAHTIISRSWLLAQIEKQEALIEAGKEYTLIHETVDEYVRWYDREDHDEFHVCADDHCQRYQGITKANNPAVVKAVTDTSGEVLVFGNRICDARFSKCCGGITETFENCWEPVIHPYLQRVVDKPGSVQLNTVNGNPIDLKIEAVAARFIEGTPDAFCNTDDATLLRQVLNDYDQTSSDFYRWDVTFSQGELAALIREKSGIDFGDIIDLMPIERGESGRIVRLKIVGTRKTLIVGKELEIRRWLSPSHLYSSAFIVEKSNMLDQVPGEFKLRGAGWGHGVGLCQIGAAVMASKEYSHTEILMHYFRDAFIEKRYE